MAIPTPKLPYATDALTPHISSETLEFHFGKHHLGYVKKLNAAVAGTPDDDKSLEELVKTTSGKLFNLAAQAWNHDFYWHCLSPAGGGSPGGELAAAIEARWGSFAAFQSAFTAAAGGHFGSGWAWLVRTADGTLEIRDTHDADTPLAHGETPLLTCDVWEHAYYIDRRNDRGAYIAAFWELVDWSTVATR